MVSRERHLIVSFIFWSARFYGLSILRTRKIFESVYMHIFKSFLARERGLHLFTSLLIRIAFFPCKRLRHMWLIPQNFAPHSDIVDLFMILKGD